MGTRKSEYTFATTVGSDSGYGDEIAGSSGSHPLSRKGYEIGPAAKLKVGDVFEFLWADCPEFEWDWKCLGYTRFIVLRHSDSFPHYCACVPISCGPKQEFAKPGIDTLQQGYVYASGERDKDPEKDRGENGHYQVDKDLPKLPYSSVGINLHNGRHRVKEDSRANYADIIEIDHEAQVMVIGDVARYFDRIRKNVNKAFMRQILRQALEGYCTRKREERKRDSKRAEKVNRIIDGQEHEDQGSDMVTEADGKQAQDPRMSADEITEMNDWNENGEDGANGEEDDGQDKEFTRPAMITRRQTESAVRVKPGLDRVDLSPTSSRRDNDEDDARSLRSMAMAGRASRFSLKR